MDVEKEKMIKRDITKYKKIFKDLPDDGKLFAEKLFTKAAFIDATLDELQNKINEEGPIIESQNGNGFITKSENPAQKSYNVMIKNYNAIIKTLNDLLPDQPKESDELTQFLTRGAG